MLFAVPLIFIVGIVASVGLPLGTPKSEVLDLSTATLFLPSQLRSALAGAPRSLLSTAGTIPDSEASEEDSPENQTAFEEPEANISDLSETNAIPHTTTVMHSSPQNESEGDLAELAPSTVTTVVTTVSTCISGGCISSGQAESPASETASLVHIDTALQEPAPERQAQPEASTNVTPEAEILEAPTNAAPEVLVEPADPHEAKALFRTAGKSHTQPDAVGVAGGPDSIFASPANSPGTPPEAKPDLQPHVAAHAAEGFQDGHKAGKREGFEEGKRAGFEEGKRQGFEKALALARAEIINVGHAKSQQEGLEEEELAEPEASSAVKSESAEQKEAEHFES